MDVPRWRQPLSQRVEFQERDTTSPESHRPVNQSWKMKSYRQWQNQGSNVNFNPRTQFSQPYQKRQMLSILKETFFPNKVSSLLAETPSQPKPLLSPDTVERLRNNLRFGSNMPFSTTDDWGYECEQDSNDYVDEEDTKQKLEEIIAVAQTLRDQLNREEELRRIQSLINDDESRQFPNAIEEEIDECEYEDDRELYQRRPNFSPPVRPVRKPFVPIVAPNREPGKIPSLLDLKPAIPSLMDLKLKPPVIDNLIQENTIVATNNFKPLSNVIDRCWNCNKLGHTYDICRFPKMRQFCYRCGKLGFDVSSCPYCQID